MLRIPVTAALLLASTSAWALEVGQKVSNFRLEDSMGNRYTLDSFKEKVVLFWYEGKNSKEQNRRLKNELKKIRDRKAIPHPLWASVGIANFQETAWPNFIINMAIKKEAKATGVLILCDRSGFMMQKWGFKNGLSNIFMLDSSRTLRWKSAGPLSKKAGQQLIELLYQLTAAPSSPVPQR